MSPLGTRGETSIALAVLDVLDVSDPCGQGKSFITGRNPIMMIERITLTTDTHRSIVFLKSACYSLEIDKAYSVNTILVTGS